jgi:pseudouridine synthase
MKHQISIIRLDKFLSHAGVASRKDIKQVLKQYEVTVNGKRVKSSGVRVNLVTDEVCLAGKKIELKEYVYYALNKPKDVVSTTADPLGRESVVDLIDTHEKIFPIGRLDKDTHGLLILTNDGELTHKLIHPKYHVPKKYRLIVAEDPTEEQLQAFRKGVLLREGITKEADIELISNHLSVNQTEKLTTEKLLSENGKLRTDNRVTLQVILYEGKYRQIRRMCEALGITLLDLQRISFGPISLGELKVGEYKELSEGEITALKNA